MLITVSLVSKICLLGPNYTGIQEHLCHIIKRTLIIYQRIEVNSRALSISVAFKCFSRFFFFFWEEGRMGEVGEGGGVEQFL